MTGSRFVACFAALALSTSACGVFGSGGGDDDDLTAGPIGGNAPDVTTAPTSVRPTTTTTAPKPRVTANPNACKQGDNTSEVRYDPGILIEFKVSTTCAARGADVQLSLKVINKSNRTINYNPNYDEFFSIKAPRGENKASWKDRDCTPPPAGDRNKPAGTIAPGASLDFSTKYPAPDGIADREKCRRLETGPYDAHAVFLLCEDEAYVDGYCEIGKAQQLFAQPIRIIFLKP